MHRRALLTLALLLAACGTATESAPPAPDMRIGLSYAAQFQRQALLACIPIDSAERISIDLVFGDATDMEDYDLILRLGEAGAMPAFAVQLTQDQIVALTNPANPLRELSRAQLADLFSGRVTDWSQVGGDTGEVHLWIGFESDETRSLFRSAVMQGAEFSGGAQLAATPALMIAAIAADPDALGILPASLLPDNLVGLPTGVHAPVLALADAEPEGALRDIVACLQGVEGND